jgi:membrane associated rhomboid family serine protease
VDLLLSSIPVIRLLGIAWIVFFLDKSSGDRLSRIFRLQPRSLFGLVGIATSPFLHSNQSHIVGNSSAFLVLGLLIAAQGQNMFYFVSAVLTVTTGLLVWLFSSNPVIGASGVIFGYLGYLLMFGMTVDEGWAWGAGAIAFVIYGSLWVGIFPSAPGVSWLTHAMGFVSGIALGYVLGLRAIELGVYS